MFVLYWDVLSLGEGQGQEAGDGDGVLWGGEGSLRHEEGQLQAHQPYRQTYIIGLVIDGWEGGGYFLGRCI